MSDLFLGETIDPSTHARSGSRLGLDTASLTTHGVIVGMTGSGKTGLGVVMIEEALLAGIPVLALDPKGDLSNLALTFPGLTAAEFAPWVESGDPAKVATIWKDGLASWGLGTDRIVELRSKADITVLTPGSNSGVPLNVIGSLAPPKGADDLELRADEVGGIVSGLLALAGREHILLANLIDRAWTSGTALDLPALVDQVQRPPLRKLGVIDLEAFYPEKDRTKLAMALNGLLASPSFAAWNQGIALDPETLLWNGERPRCAIVSLAHLSDAERQFVVTLVLGRLITWMRSQAGTSQLRVLVYFDEVFGYVPPTANPPSKKPVLTLMKQARAFGVGMVLATQNPVDLDYKAISNAGTWLIGRLQTERDRDRLLDGMSSVTGDIDVAALASTIAALDKREFVMHRAGSPKPVVFTSRWSMSYLRGPLTRDQLRALTSSDSPGPATIAATPSQVLAHDETSVAPRSSLPAKFTVPAAPWLPAVGAEPNGTRLDAALLARVHLLYDDDAAELRHTEEWEAVLYPVAETFDPKSVHIVDHDDRDFRADAPPNATFILPTANLTDNQWGKRMERALIDHLVSTLSLPVQRNRELKLWSRSDETADAFAARCEAAADTQADTEGAELRTKLEAKIHKVEDALAEAKRRKDELDADVRAHRTDTLLSGAGELLGALLGGRRGGARALGRAVRAASSGRSRTARSAQREESADARMSEKLDELTQLEGDLAGALLDVDARWSAAAKAIDVIEIPLEKTDLAVLEFAICWLPMSATAARAPG